MWAERSENRVVDFYLSAKETLLAGGFAGELDWQAQRRFDDVDESDFLREGAWTILCSGFREASVRSVFPSVSAAFLEWEGATTVVTQLDRCRANALVAFNHLRKIDAICELVRRVQGEGFVRVKDSVRRHGLDYVSTLPYMGQVTSRHFLKNLGVAVAKPDRHLVRIAQVTGIGNVDRLCGIIAEVTGDGVAEVDLVFWRYATTHPRYVSQLKEAVGLSTGK